MKIAAKVLALINFFLGLFVSLVLGSSLLYVIRGLRMYLSGYNTYFFSSDIVISLIFLMIFLVVCVLNFSVFYKMMFKTSSGRDIKLSLLIIIALVFFYFTFIVLTTIIGTSDPIL